MARIEESLAASSHADLEFLVNDLARILAANISLWDRIRVVEWGEDSEAILAHRHSYVSDIVDYVRVREAVNEIEA
jgi:hypothetical protein